MADGFNETPVRGKLRSNAAPADATAVATLGAVAGNADPIFTEGNMVALSTDLGGNLRVRLADPDGGGALVDVSDRAARLLGTVALDAASVTALESVDLNSATLSALTGALESVSLNADTLAALESVDLNLATRDDIVGRLTTAIANMRDTLSTNLESVTVGGTVDLAAATLAALENVTVGGTVALDAATLSALENVTVGGTVALDAATLTALEDTAVRNPTDAAGAVIPLTVTSAGGTQDVSGSTVALDAATLAALESLDINVASRDDIVNRLSANLESVDINIASRDDLVTRLSAALESVDLNLATRDDIVGRLTTAITNMRDTLSTNLESVSLNAGTIADVQRVFVRGAEVADANPLPVVMQAGTGTMRDSGILESVNVAPGATVSLTGPTVGTGVTAHLVELTASSSVRLKVELVSVGGATPVRHRVFFVKENEAWVYGPTDRDALAAIGATTTAGATGAFQLNITNMDNMNTANVYGSLTQIEV